MILVEMGSNKISDEKQYEQRNAGCTKTMYVGMWSEFGILIQLAGPSNKQHLLSCNMDFS